MAPPTTAPPNPGAMAFPTAAPVPPPITAPFFHIVKLVPS